MLFNSFAYAVFLPCVFILYWILPHKFRWPLLLVASYWFYMSWNAAYVVLIYNPCQLALRLMHGKNRKQKAEKAVCGRGTVRFPGHLVCFQIL